MYSFSRNITSPSFNILQNELTNASQKYVIILEVLFHISHDITYDKFLIPRQNKSKHNIMPKRMEIIFPENSSFCFKWDFSYISFKGNSHRIHQKYVKQLSYLLDSLRLVLARGLFILFLLTSQFD